MFLLSLRRIPVAREKPSLSTFTPVQPTYNLTCSRQRAFADFNPDQTRPGRTSNFRFSIFSSPHVLEEKEKKQQKAPLAGLRLAVPAGDAGAGQAGVETGRAGPPAAGSGQGAFTEYT